MLHNERLRRFETSLFTVIRKRRFDATGRRILGTRHHTGVTTLGKLIEHAIEAIDGMLAVRPPQVTSERASLGALLSSAGLERCLGPAGRQSRAPHRASIRDL